jgi:hypothetical protein
MKRSGPGRHHFPNTPAKVPFLWTIGNPPMATTYDIEMIGGLIGVSQNPDTLCLRPEIGWAVRDLNRVKAAEESVDGSIRDSDHSFEARMQAL